MSTDEDHLTDSSRLRRAFPDAAGALFFEQVKISGVLESCQIVLDTNVLLLPYTTSPQTLGAIAIAYKTLAQEGRIYIPGHVAREFTSIRPSKIGDIFSDVKRKQSGSGLQLLGKYPLLERVPAYQQAIVLGQQIGKQVSEYRELMGEIATTIQEWGWGDPVSALYGEILRPENVCETSISEADFLADLHQRREKKIPPGYKDAGKSTNPDGDLRIWHSILEVGKAKKTALIFVSGDEKSDWHQQGAGQALFPRYELIDEYRRASEGGSFFKISFAKFLELFRASGEAIAEVRAAEVEISQSRASEERIVTDGFLRIDRTLSGATALFIGKDFEIETGGVEPEMVGLFNCEPCRVGQVVSTSSNFSGSFLGRGPCEINSVRFERLFWGGELRFRGSETTVEESWEQDGLIQEFDLFGELVGYLESAFIPKPYEPSVRTKLSGTGTMRARFRAYPTPDGKKALSCSTIEYSFSAT